MSKIYVHKRLHTRIALAVVTILAAAGVSSAVAQGAAPDAVEAAGSSLSCDQNTVYGITSGGDLLEMNATTGATTLVHSISPATNGLAITKNGTMAWAFQSGGNTIVSFDPQTDTVTPINNVDLGATRTVIRGAVNPVNGIFYYAGNGSSARLAAYDTVNNTEIGQIGTITGLGGNNGDMAFGSDGTLYVVDGAEVYSIDSVPTTAGAVNLAAVPFLALPAGTNSPGIAYSSDGYLYVAASTSTAELYKINPSSGSLDGTITTSTAVVDLATCNYANSLRGQTDVRSRAANTDQFTLTNTGNGVSTGNTATTSGTATGIQSAVAGPNLTVGGLVYTVTQSASGTTNLANYSVGWTCVNRTTGSTVASGTGNVASFTNPMTSTADGTDVVCTFLTALLPDATDDSYATPRNTTLTVGAGSGLLANDTGATITRTSNTATTHGTVTVAADGSFSYVPTAGYIGTDTFDYTITDANGTTSTATATIDVTPTAADDLYSTPMGTPLDISDLTGNDSPSTMTVQSITQPSHGTTTLVGGVVTYTPTAGYIGSDSFTYTASDGNGHTPTATVAIDVAPVAADDSYTTPAGTALSITDLTGNDSPSTMTVQSVGTPAHGTAVLSGGVVTYTPTAGYVGSDSFTYTATDGNGHTPTATVTIEVVPEAQDDTYSTPTNTPLTISDLTANDVPTSLTVQSVSAPAHGTAVLNTDGTVTYTPTAGYTGPDSFTYTATDGNGHTTTATVSITVAAVAADDQVTGKPNTPTVITPLDNDTPSAGSSFDPATLQILDPATGTWGTHVTLPGQGTWSVVGSELQFVPVPDYVGTAPISYRVDDTSGATVTATAEAVYLPTLALAYTNAGVPSFGEWGLGAAGVLVGLALLMIAAARRRLAAHRAPRHRVA